MAFTLDDLKALTELLQDNLELRVALAEQILDEQVITRLMHQNERLRESFRRAVLTDELINLPQEFREFREEVNQRFDRVDQRLDKVEQAVGELRQELGETRQELGETRQEVGELRQELGETRQEVGELRQELGETRQEVGELRQEVGELRQEVGELRQELGETRQEVGELRQELGETRQEVGELRQDVKSLQDWRRGEEARRAGEDYERKIVRRAVRIFGVGESGSPKTHEHVYRQVVEWLMQGGVLDGDVPDEDDPLNADLIWWKGNHVAVAEISLKVDKYDVLRAKRRAEPLRQAGLEVMPVVIGMEWAHPETEQLANQEGVGWRVGNFVSDSLVAFRKASASE